MKPCVSSSRRPGFWPSSTLLRAVDPELVLVGDLPGAEEPGDEGADAVDDALQEAHVVVDEVLVVVAREELYALHSWYSLDLCGVLAVNGASEGREGEFVVETSASPSVCVLRTHKARQPRSRVAA